MTIAEFNKLPAAEAAETLGGFCGVTAWINHMVSARPFTGVADMLSKAEEYWRGLDEKDHLETFDYHAKIGDLESLKKKYAGSQGVSQREQAGLAGANEKTVEALARGNLDYEKKFGFIFLVFATGKSASEMLQLLQQRLKNDRPAEIKNVVEEQNKITLLRIKKYFNEEA